MNGIARLAGLLGLALLSSLAWSRAPAAGTVRAAHDHIARLIAASGAEVAVAWQPLNAKRGEQILINTATRFHAASTMKLPVMIELFRQVAKKKLRLADTLIVSNHFVSMVDGSPYEISADGDSDGDVYHALGQPMTLGLLCEHMITRSSNLAANLLMVKLGPKNVQATINRLGASGMQVVRGVGDQKAFDRGLNNTTDAMGLFTLLREIGRGEVISRAASADMVEILKRQTANDGIPSGLPAGTPVAHKTGTITGIHHDAAIVYAPRPYVLVVLVRGITDQAVSAKLMGDITRVADPLVR
jgi:beta-lactamase class A